MVAEQQQFEWVSTAQLAADAAALAARIPADCSGIVGVPRSGMIPAAILATHLHLPLFAMQLNGHLQRMGVGSRGGKPLDPEGPLVVIDDTAYAGHALRRARSLLGRRKALYGSVYVTPQALPAVDLFARVLQSPHLLEWNITNNGPWVGRAANPIYRRGVATDMDGILCHDPTMPDADDGPGLERYRQWLLDAPPRWIPRAQPTRLIVTARLEKFRPETESWLKKWGVECERLVMYPADKASQRRNVAAYKAAEYGRSGCGFFVESDREQAREIFRLTQRPVICPDAATVFAQAGPRPESLKSDIASKCRACDSAAVDFLWHDQDGWRWYRCRGCGSDTSAAPYAASGYGEAYLAKLIAGEGGSLEAAIGNHQHNADLFDKYHRLEDKTFLDVGTAHGASQLVMQARGWSSTGFDVEAAGRPAGTIAAPEFRAELLPRQFAAVLAREVLEHVADPRGLLRELFLATLPGGVCQITTPRPLPSGYEWRCYQAAHLCLWSPDHLAQVVRQIGFLAIERSTWDLGQKLVCRRPLESRHGQ